MAVPEQQFQTIIEQIEQTVKETIATQLQIAQINPSPSFDLNAFGEELQIVKQELLKEILHVGLLSTVGPRTVVVTDPLAFYEAILKIRSHPNASHNYFTSAAPNPYFADVFNDVVSYFGGTNTLEARGRWFLKEAEKRFSYLPAPPVPFLLGNPPVFYEGMMRLANGSTKNAQGIDVAIPVAYGPHEFQVLRQLIEETMEKFPLKSSLLPDPITATQLEKTLQTFRETLLKDIQAYIKTEKKEKELDKAVITMQQALEAMQKTRGLNDNDPAKLPAADDSSFTF